jgi:hypothetical protein
MTLESDDAAGEERIAHRDPSNDVDMGGNDATKVEEETAAVKTEKEEAETTPPGAATPKPKSASAPTTAAAPADTIVNIPVTPTTIGLPPSGKTSTAVVPPQGTTEEGGATPSASTLSPAHVPVGIMAAGEEDLDNLKPEKVLFPEPPPQEAPRQKDDDTTTNIAPLVEQEPEQPVPFGAHVKYRLYPDQYQRTLLPFAHVADDAWRDGHRDRKQMMEAVVSEANKVATFADTVARVMRKRPRREEAAAVASPSATREGDGEPLLLLLPYFFP